MLKAHDLTAGFLMALTKLDVAAQQLDTAIRLFLEEDYVSSLTLAGAAEEILGRLSKRAGLPVAVEEVIQFHWNDTDPLLPDNERKRILLAVLNDPRNQAKHANDPDEQMFDNAPDYPLQMIMRAMPMARRLARPPSREAEMVRWIRAHVGPEGIR
jgi:hypothetical protein